MSASWTSSKLRAFHFVCLSSCRQKWHWAHEEWSLTSLKSVQTAGFVSGAKWVCSLERFSCWINWIIGSFYFHKLFFFSTSLTLQQFLVNWLQLLEICMHIWASSFYQSSSGGATSVPRAKVSWAVITSKQAAYHITYQTNHGNQRCLL